jgi:hypothetical protein
MDRAVDASRRWPIAQPAQRVAQPASSRLRENGSPRRLPAPARGGWLRACSSCSSSRRSSFTSLAATEGTKRRKRRNRSPKKPIVPEKMLQSTQVGRYMAHDDGRKSRCSEVTMMTKRSNHMPTLTKIEITQTRAVFSRIFLNQKSCGEITLQVIMIQ